MGFEAKSSQAVTATQPLTKQEVQVTKTAKRRPAAGPKVGMAALALICAQSSIEAHADGTYPASAALAPADSADAAYRQGHDFYEKKNYAEAMHWYRVAAAQGNALAQVGIGFFYLSGWGVPQDSLQALNWFRKAADRGNEVAQRNIGMMFLQGMGVAADRAEAIRWFRLAAAKGDDDAKEALQYLGAQ
jgi:TPR repeat protein